MKSDRVSASIKSKKLKLYIEDTASKKGLSVSAFIEDVLNKKMQEGISIPQGISTGMIRTKARGSDFEGCTLNDFTIISQICDTLHIQFPIHSPYKVKAESELELNENGLLAKIRDRIKKELGSNIDYHTFKPMYGYGDLKNLVIPLFLVEIVKITIKDFNDKEQIDIINEAKNTFLANIEKQVQLTTRYFHDEDKKLSDIMIKSATNSSATVEVKYRFKFLPIYLNTPYGEIHRYYDFLNIKYQRYNYPKENQTYTPEPFICLMRGKYGYLSCRVFDSPQDIQSYIEKYEKLKIEGKTFENGIIKFLPDPASFKNNLKLLKEIKSIQDQKRKIRDSLVEDMVKKYHLSIHK